MCGVFLSLPFCNTRVSQTLWKVPGFKKTWRNPSRHVLFARARIYVIYITRTVCSGADANITELIIGGKLWVASVSHPPMDDSATLKLITVDITSVSLAFGKRSPFYLCRKSIRLPTRHCSDKKREGRRRSVPGLAQRHHAHEEPSALWVAR